MRCKKHPCDQSSTVGVCASCLRERLSALIVAQAHAHAHARASAPQDHRKSEPHPPPPVFPRSVSPYVSRRKSDDSARHRHIDSRFYSTPQLGPTFTPVAPDGRSAKKKNGRFSLLTNLFRSRSDKLNQNSEARFSSRDSCETSSSSASPFRFQNMIAGRRKKPNRLFSMEKEAAGGRRNCRTRDRGMSPAGGTDSDYDGEESPSVSGYSSESSQCWQKTPISGPITAPVRRSKPGPTRNISGLAFCLSPLVRASPNRHWSQKSGLTPEMSYSGEMRKTTAHLSTAVSFCKNRSRKLADFGREGFHNHH